MRDLAAARQFSPHLRAGRGWLVRTILPPGIRLKEMVMLTLSAAQDCRPGAGRHRRGLPGRLLQHDEAADRGAGVFFEGAGDALFCGDTLWAGYRFRSDYFVLPPDDPLLGLGAGFGCGFGCGCGFGGVDDFVGGFCETLGGCP
jgi:hypothetical protein